jgi:hypothetical protein
MPSLRVCPFSIVVFVSTVVIVSRQKRRQLRKETETKVSDKKIFNVVFVLGAPGVGT